MGTGIKKDRKSTGQRVQNGGQVTKTTLIAREGILPHPAEMERYEN